MKTPILILTTILLLTFCKREQSAIEILNKTINSIDTIHTIYYKQYMSRTNPRNLNDTIFRYREMYFQRLLSDSIVGLKGHWYMYINDSINVIYEDIYDGNRLIRKNNAKKAARVYDLVKYPGFKRNHFWSHNTLYGMQYEFRHVLQNTNSYTIQKSNDTIIDNISCHHIIITLENKTTMPGFATKLEYNEGIISKTSYFFNKQTYYPIRIKGENYSINNPEQKSFLDQKYTDIKFNVNISDNQFNTSDKSIIDYEIREMKPQ